jgi:hypothetical protein
LFIPRFAGWYLDVCPTAEGVPVRDQRHAIALAVLDMAVVPTTEIVPARAYTIDRLSGWIRSRLV